MVRAFGYKVGFKKKPQVNRLTASVLALVIGLWVIQMVVGVLHGIINFSNSTAMFYPVWQFLGVIPGTNGMLVVAGILLVVNLITSIININRG